MIDLNSDLNSDLGEGFGAWSMGDGTAMPDVVGIAIRAFARAVWN